MMTDRLDVFQYGNARSFTGRQLAEIAFPLGGIGTGTVSLGGRGQLRDWEIFNRSAKGNMLPYSFFAIWVQSGDEPPVARVLERQILPPYSGGQGVIRGQVTGLPRLAEAQFNGAYPFAQIEFQDDQLPVTVTLEAFNPLIPLDPDASGLPVAVLRYKVHNPNAYPVRVSIAGTVMNAIGCGASDAPGAADDFGQNVNEYVYNGTLRGLRMSSAKYPEDSPRFGTMALSTTHKALTCQCTGVGLPHFWDRFAEDGGVDDPGSNEPSGDGSTHQGALCLSAELLPGQTVEFPFFITWHFPNRTATGCGWETSQPEDDWLGNYYCTRFADAGEVAEYVVSNLDWLEQQSRQYVAAMLSSTLPDYVIDAAMSNVSTLRTQTCFRIADGSFHAFEGCSDGGGCCHGTCTHVWNYEHTTAFLFPSLSRSIRETEFLNDTWPDGLMSFRTSLPLGTESRRNAAADGQMGCVMKLYRDWQLCGDDKWLRKLWPPAKKALEFAWIEGGGDGDQDGVMEGIQHSTYDVEYHGPNPQCGTWYLGALRAAEEMARAVGEEEAAQKYQQLFRNGSRWVDENLFNGEYYIQQVRSQVGRKVADGLILGYGSEITQEPKFQVGIGCLADQLIGQYFAYIVELGYLLDHDNMRRAVQAVFQHNFKPNLSAHACLLRTFALNDEAGTVICTWPHGGRPHVPMYFASEVWTSMDYLLGTLLLYEGLIPEGLAVIRAARQRHDGEKRNPWNEAECGHHYARAMAAWAPILALSGFHYSGVSGEMKFAPITNTDDFRCVWSTPAAWGLFGQRRSGENFTWRLSPLHGEQRLQALSLALSGEGDLSGIKVAVDWQELPVETEIHTDRLQIRFAEPLTIGAGQELTVIAAQA